MSKRTFLIGCVALALASALTLKTHAETRGLNCSASSLVESDPAFTIVNLQPFTGNPGAVLHPSGVTIPAGATISIVWSMQGATQSNGMFRDQRSLFTLQSPLSPGKSQQLYLSPSDIDTLGRNSFVCLRATATW